MWGWIAFWSAAGLILWRLRGSDLFGRTKNRLIWSIPVGFMVLHTTGNVYYGLAAIALSFLGACTGYFGAEYDLEKPQFRNLKNYALLIASGMWRFYPLFLGSLFLGMGLKVFPAVIAGACIVSVYLAGIWLVARLKIKPLFIHFAEYGEGLFGAIIMGALAWGLYV